MDHSNFKVGDYFRFHLYGGLPTNKHLFKVTAVVPPNIIAVNDHNLTTDFNPRDFMYVERFRFLSTLEKIFYETEKD